MLTSGIQDMYPIPVIGILNERPKGPCINTKVDIQKVKSAITDLLEASGPSTSSSARPPARRHMTIFCVYVDIRRRFVELTPKSNPGIWAGDPKG